jgi:hypothetical protein
MALFKSQLITAVSGSIGGVTYAHNAGGMYMRGRATPTNPKTPQQVQVRQACANVAQAWKTLTDEQREAWKTYGLNTSVINGLGDSHTLSGINWFVGCNTLRVRQGLALTLDGPAEFGRADLTPPSLSSTAINTLTLTFPSPNLDDWAAADSHGALLVFVGRPTGLTTNFYNGSYKYAGKIAAGVTATGAQVLPISEVVNMNQKCFVRLVSQTGDGRYSLANIQSFNPEYT